jgi:hypothetical protein
MKNYSKILPFGLLIIADTAYNNFAPLYSTNWSIFYFCTQNLAFALLLYMFSNGSFWKRLPFYSLALAYLVKIVINLLKINSPFEEYIESVNNLEANLLLTLFIIISLSIVLGKLYNLFGWVSQKFFKRG